MRYFFPFTVALLLLTTVVAAERSATPSEPGAVVEWIFFDSDQATIKSEFDALLSELAGRLGPGKSRRVELRGHIDAFEAKRQGQTLAQRRIEAVLARLRDLGVDVQRIERSPRGTADPWGGNDNEEGRALNRRVDVVRYLPVPEGQAGAAPEPVIEFPEARYRFPSAVEGDMVVHAFTVRNTGRADLRITKVRTD